MNSRKLIMLWMIIGSIAGGYTPTLWGGGGINQISVLTSTIGGILGVVLGYKFSQS